MPYSMSSSFCRLPVSCRLFLNSQPTTAIAILSLRDALPIFEIRWARRALLFDLGDNAALSPTRLLRAMDAFVSHTRSEEHTSELQSLTNLVCRLLLEKKKTE